jgi:hypothetical protein
VEPEPVHEPAPQTEAAESRNFFSCLGGVYSSPAATFAAIGRSPQVLMPIIALIVIGLLLGYFMTQRIDMGALAVDQLEQQVAKGRITQEQFDQLKQRVAASPQYRTVISIPIQFLLLALIIAGIAKLVSSAFLGAENRFKAIFSVTLFAWIAVSIVYYGLYVLILYFKNPGEINASNVNSLVASNLGALITGILGDDALPGFLTRLAGWVDLFAIWKIALLAIGYSAVSRKLKTDTAATWLGVVYGITALIGSAIGSLFGQ